MSQSFLITLDIPVAQIHTVQKRLPEIFSFIENCFHLTASFFRDYHCALLINSQLKFKLFVLTLRRPMHKCFNYTDYVTTAMLSALLTQQKTNVKGQPSVHRYNCNCVIMRCAVMQYSSTGVGNFSCRGPHL